MPNGDVLNQAEINKPINLTKKNIKRRGIMNGEDCEFSNIIIDTTDTILEKIFRSSSYYSNIKIKNIHFTKKAKNLSNFLQAEYTNYISYFSVFDMNEMTKDVNLTDFFKGCNRLTYVEFKNLRKGFEKAGAYTLTGASVLDKETVLPQLLYELLPQDEVVEIKMDALGDYLSTHYCTIIDKTDPKKKFKICKETDREAMTLLNYALKKNWKIIK